MTKDVPEGWTTELPATVKPDTFRTGKPKGAMALYSRLVVEFDVYVASWLVDTASLPSTTTGQVQLFLQASSGKSGGHYTVRWGQAGGCKSEYQLLNGHM
jgi:hypothetical protein